MARVCGEKDACGGGQRPLAQAMGAVLALAMLAAAPNLQAQTGADTREYALPAQSLGQALNDLAVAADRQILVPPDLVRGRSAPALSGRYTMAQALSHLLAGTGLGYRVSDGGVVTIVAAPPKAMPRQPESDVRPTQQDPPAEEDPLQLDTVSVTGTRLKRTDFEGASPIISITREDIDRSGFSTVRELMGTLPQASVSIDESGSNSFLGASTIQLRGLSYGSTLILINGKRVSASSSQASRNFFDLNSIPLEAIDRVEILTDTASAIYGGDAIGGAVNFILRRDFEGAVAGARYGTSYKGDASERGASFTIGGSGGRFDGLMVFDYFERDPLYKSERELTSTEDYRRYGGIDQRSTMSYPGNIYALPGTGNLPGLQNPFAGAPGGGGAGLTPGDFAATDGLLNKTDLAGFAALVPKSRRAGVLATGNLQLDGGARVFGELIHSRNEQRIEFGPDALNGGAVGLYVVPAENPFNPFGVDVGVDYRFVELGPRQNRATNEFTRALIGAEGSWASVDWEVSLLSDRDNATIVNGNFIDPDAVRSFLQSTDPAVALNVFCSTSCNNPDTLDAIRATTTDIMNGGSTMLEGSVSGQLPLFGHSLSYAVGASRRRDTLEWQSGLDADRDITAAFMELSLPLLSGDDGRRLEFNFAGRYDDYSDFGSSFNPQFGVVWKPNRSLLLRASAGTAFKAPSMFDLYAPLTGSPSAVTTDPLRNDEVVQYELRFGGNPRVRPEDATSYTIGFIVEPEKLPGFSFGANAFQVEQEDFITRFLDYQMFLRNPQLFDDRIHRAEPTAEDVANGLPGRLLGIDATTLNFGEVVVRGVDLQSTYRFSSDRLGDFVWSLNGSYIDSYKVALLPGQPATEQVGHANRAGYPVSFKGNTSLGWTGHGGLGASLLARYLHSYLDYDGVGRLPSQWWFDVQASYDFGRGGITALDGLSAALGVINLSNNQGDYADSFAGYDFQQADLRGRFFYLQLKYAF